MHMVHMFEQIHFSLFFVMVVFLLGALWLLIAAIRVESRLDAYEVFIRTFSKSLKVIATLKNRYYFSITILFGSFQNSSSYLIII